MIIYLLAAFGLAYIVGHSTISLPFRVWLGGVPEKFANPLSFDTPDGAPAKPGALGPFGDFMCAMIECPACFGFWIGVTAALTGVIPVHTEFADTIWPATWRWFTWPVMLGCVTAGSNYAISRLTRLI